MKGRKPIREEMPEIGQRFEANANEAKFPYQYVQNYKKRGFTFVVERLDEQVFFKRVA